MSQLLVKEKPKASTTRSGIGRDGDRPWGDGRRFEGALPVSRYSARIAVWFLLAAITMLFVAFTSTYLARRGEADWVPITAPRILWLNTAVLLLSSGVLERARRALRRGRLQGVRYLLLGATLLGVAFLIGQLLAWRQLVDRGIFLRGNPHSAFFYLLSGAHGVHVLGGIMALGLVTYRVWRGRSSPLSTDAVDLCATYWHFLDGLWAYLFVLLFWL